MLANEIKEYNTAELINLRTWDLTKITEIVRSGIADFAKECKKKKVFIFNILQFEGGVGKPTIIFLSDSRNSGQ
jgi:hypothetical protein